MAQVIRVRKHAVAFEDVPTHIAFVQQIQHDVKDLPVPLVILDVVRTRSENTFCKFSTFEDEVRELGCRAMRAPV